MKFTRLRLSGFKSFVDPTELRIEDGLTGIVGPNGCGKSNLVEALRWVMGENAPSSMRSKGMEDVIFAGTAQRPARNIAEVSLLIDNRERRAPALFNDADEIEISRRIERDMGSLYRISGREVRAKDVQLLFADASTGARSPSLVGQGRIAQLIGAKPTERRAVLEEAAGIAGLHSRRREAEQKLRGAETNLARVQDVIDQLEQRIAQLKRQARQAERYRALSQRIRTLEAALLWRRWQEAGAALRASEQALQAAEARLAETTAAASALSREHAEVELALAPLREAANEAAAGLQRLRLEREQIAREEAGIAERATDLAHQLEQLEGDAEHERTSRADAAAALQRLASERERLQALLENAREREREYRQALQATVRRADRAEAEFDALSQELAVSRGRRASLQSDLLTLERRADRIAEDLAVLADEKTREAGLAQARRRVEVAAGRLERADEAARTLADEREALQGACEEAAADRNALLAEQAAARAQCSGIESEIAALERGLARDEEEGGDALAGLEVPEGLERAVGALLGEAASARLEMPGESPQANGEETAGTQRRWRPLPAYPQDALPELPEGALALSSLLPSVSPPLARRIALAGLMRGDDPTKLASEMRDRQAELAAGQVLVSEDGLIATWDGFFGHVGDEAEAAHRLVRHNRLKRLRKSLATARERAEAIDERLARAEEESARLEGELAILEKRTRELDNERQATGRERDEAARELARLEARCAAERERAAALNRQAEEIAARRQELEAALAELPAEAALEKQLVAVRGRLEEARTVLAQARAEYDGHSRERDEAAGRLESLAGEEDAWRARLDRAQRRIEDLERRSKALAEERRRLAQDPERLATKRRALEERIEQLEQAARLAADRLAEKEDRKRVLDKALDDAREALALAREERARLEADRSHCEERLAEIVHEIEERLETDARRLAERMARSDFAETPPAIDELEADLATARAQRERLGAVNLRAEEEEAELAEQRNHLATERKDLEQAIARLRQAISSLNREGRERLLEAFDKVNSHFGALFTRLFGGGHAHLELVESDDPLEAGIEIMASPPGKRLQSLSLLSGGEQTLTSISLIFAVFMTNPAPICVLDEVDAPLDEANVDRFCNLLDEMVAHSGTRFLVVTHNEVTMSRMHRLYGVTMVERGVSQLVSVDLERAESLLAAE